MTERVASITVMIPSLLREYCGARTELVIDATNVRDLLGRMEALYPRLYQNVCDETGAVRRHVNLFINTNNMRDRAGLDTPLEQADVVTILPAVSGG